MLQLIGKYLIKITNSYNQNFMIFSNKRDNPSCVWIVKLLCVGVFDSWTCLFKWHNNFSSERSLENLYDLNRDIYTQQLTKMCVKQSHLLLICKGWSFIKQNNLWLLLKMAKLFYQVKEENFSAKISNWEHSRYCEKIQTILFSMLHSQHWYRKHRCLEKSM